jgi:hypothetical protein
MGSRRPVPRASPMRGCQAPFELLKSSVIRFDLHDRYHLLVAASWPVFALTAFAFVMVLNVVFALLYALGPGAVQNLATGESGRPALLRRRSGFRLAGRLLFDDITSRHTANACQGYGQNLALGAKPKRISFPIRTAGFDPHVIGTLSDRLFQILHLKLPS